MCGLQSNKRMFISKTYPVNIQEKETVENNNNNKNCCPKDFWGVYAWDFVLCGLTLYCTEILKKRPTHKILMLDL